MSWVAVSDRKENCPLLILCIGKGQKLKASFTNVLHGNSHKTI